MVGRISYLENLNVLRGYDRITPLLLAESAIKLHRAVYEFPKRNEVVF